MVIYPCIVGEDRTDNDNIHTDPVPCRYMLSFYCRICYIIPHTSGFPNRHTISEPKGPQPSLILPAADLLLFDNHKGFARHGSSFSAGDFSYYFHMISPFMGFNGFIIIVFAQKRGNGFRFIIFIQINDCDFSCHTLLNIWGRFQNFNSANNSCGSIRSIF